MYNVTLKHVLATVVAVEKQWVLHSLSVALGIQHEMRVHHIVVCGLPRSTLFFHITSQTEWFLKNIIEHKMCVVNFSTTPVWYIFYFKKICVRYDQKCILLFM
jgi:hypothetical protein